MEGTSQIWLVVEVLLVMAWRCLVFLSPALVLAGMWWLAMRADLIMDRIFPDLAWERSLGWFNIRATRRAEVVYRWLGYLAKLVMATALLGIVWGSVDLATLFNPPATWPVADLFVRIPVLCLSLGAWLFYLGFEIMPKLREHRELRALNKYRASLAVDDEWMERKPSSRVKHPHQKPRFEITLTPDRPRRRL